MVVFKPAPEEDPVAQVEVVPPKRDTDPLPCAGVKVPCEVVVESKVHRTRVVWAQEALARSKQIRRLRVLAIKIVLWLKIHPMNYPTLNLRL